ncbi:MAG: MBL fold metallo-hydrolase [Deltaproteobacteria bacterium]|nr:MBL fold metallo-hydrolase [Deltaproteobacteria bacterium]
MKATRIDEISPGLVHWTVRDERTGVRCDSYGLMAREGSVLVDPLSAADGVLGALGNVGAICLTTASHQRAAWRYRRLFDAPVWAPKHATGLDEPADGWFGHGDHLPGGLRALHAPGPTEESYVLLRERSDAAGILFLGDLLVRGDDGPFELPTTDGNGSADPQRALASLRALLDVEVETLCPSHGAPLATGGSEALRRALADEEARAHRRY